MVSQNHGLIDIVIFVLYCIWCLRQEKDCIDIDKNDILDIENIEKNDEKGPLITRIRKNNGLGRTVPKSKSIDEITALKANTVTLLLE